MAENLVKMSSKGQLVVPKELRDEEKFEEGDRFIPFPVEDGILFKKVDIDLEEEFKETAEKIREKFSREGISQEDIEEAIEWARKD